MNEFMQRQELIVRNVKGDYLSLTMIYSGVAIIIATVATFNHYSRSSEISQTAYLLAAFGIVTYFLLFYSLIAYVGRPVAIFNTKGISCRDWAFTLIPWDDIESLRVWGSKLVVCPKSSEKYGLDSKERNAVRFSDQRLKIDSFSIDFKQLDKSLGHTFRFIHQIRPDASLPKVNDNPCGIWMGQWWFPF